MDLNPSLYKRFRVLEGLKVIFLISFDYWLVASFSESTVYLLCRTSEGDFISLNPSFRHVEKQMSKSTYLVSYENQESYIYKNHGIL